jgi:general secretion pathway protein G
MVNSFHRRGFTLIELLVALAILATLLSIAVPRYFQSIDKANEAVLREDLTVLRDTIDKFYTDTGKYPQTLEDLIKRKYMRKLPVDPITGSSTTWVVVPPENKDMGGVFDVHSGAAENARDGTRFSTW